MDGNFEQYPLFSAEDAVRDCMKQTISHQIMQTKGQPIHQDVHEFLKDSTIFHCFESSAETIVHAYEKYSSHFDQYIMFSGEDTKLFHGHAIFLLRANNGTWFAGSPANSDVEPLFLDPISDTSITGIVSQIQQLYEGTWPSPVTIETLINDKGNSKPLQNTAEKLYTIPLIRVWLGNTTTTDYEYSYQ